MSKKTINIFIAGDSTASNYFEENKYPMHGWGQVLGEFFDDNIKVINKATSGRSTKSFIDEGRLKEIENTISTGDYLFIQFGHNDEKIEDPSRYTNAYTSYKENLKKFIKVAKEKDSTPILLTSIARRHFDNDDKLIDTHGDYLIGMKEVADEMNVLLIDLHQKTFDLIASKGSEESKKYFMWVEPSRYKGYPDGSKDDTHLNELGANTVAKMVIDIIGKSDLSISKHTK